MQDSAASTVAMGLWCLQVQAQCCQYALWTGLLHACCTPAACALHAELSGPPHLLLPPSPAPAPAPALRLMKVDEPVVATQVAKAVEYIAVRNDIPDTAEEVTEVEAETIKSLVGLLHRWGPGLVGLVGLLRLRPA